MKNTNRIYHLTSIQIDILSSILTLRELLSCYPIMEEKLKENKPLLLEEIPEEALAMQRLKQKLSRARFWPLSPLEFSEEEIDDICYVVEGYFSSFSLPEKRVLREILSILAPGAF